MSKALGSCCDVIIYDLNKGCSTNECQTKAQEYGIKRLPAVVVSGKFLDCCKVRSLSEETLKSALNISALPSLAF